MQFEMMVFLLGYDRLPLSAFWTAYERWQLNDLVLSSLDYATSHLHLIDSMHTPDTLIACTPLLGAKLGGDLCIVDVDDSVKLNEKRCHLRLVAL